LKLSLVLISLSTEFAADFMEGEKKFKYDLYKIPFSD